MYKQIMTEKELRLCQWILEYAEDYGFAAAWAAWRVEQQREKMSQMKQRGEKIDAEETVLQEMLRERTKLQQQGGSFGHYFKYESEALGAVKRSHINCG